MAEFLASAKAVAADRSRGNAGRLIFALDATMSRQPTWDLACHLQGSMFDAAAAVGGLDVQLVYFQGHGKARASRWASNAAELKDLMTGVQCQGGLTQIERVLDHAERQAAKAPLPSLVYVGDAMEEDIDVLCHKAGQLALRNTRAFMFLEGSDQTAERAFREIARLTGGVFLRFDRSSAQQLKDLLAAVATYSAGGRPALEKRGGASAKRLLKDMRQ
ncbi:MAG: VWA domain-containing protein [Pseudomonadota bacterium]